VQHLSGTVRIRSFYVYVCALLISFATLIGKSLHPKRIYSVSRNAFDRIFSQNISGYLNCCGENLASRTQVYLL